MANQFNSKVSWFFLKIKTHVWVYLKKIYFDEDLSWAWLWWIWLWWILSGSWSSTTSTRRRNLTERITYCWIGAVALFWGLIYFPIATHCKLAIVVAIIKHWGIAIFSVLHNVVSAYNRAIIDTALLSETYYLANPQVLNDALPSTAITTGSVPVITLLIIPIFNHSISADINISK